MSLLKEKKTCSPLAEWTFFLIVCLFGCGVVEYNLRAVFIPVPSSLLCVLVYTTNQHLERGLNLREIEKGRSRSSDGGINTWRRRRKQTASSSSSSANQSEELDSGISSDDVLPTVHSTFVNIQLVGLSQKSHHKSTTTPLEPVTLIIATNIMVVLLEVSGPSWPHLTCLSGTSRGNNKS